MIDEFDIATFRTKDGRQLLGRVIGVGERIATVRAIGLGTVHRVAYKNLAKMIVAMSIATMTERNHNAKTAAEKRRADDQLIKAERKRKLAEYDRDGFPTRYDFMDGATH